MQEMGERYMGSLYHLLQTNCNHFSSDLCYALVGKRPPAWINRLADVMVSVHCLFPPTWLPPLKPPTVEPSAGAPGSCHVPCTSCVCVRLQCRLRVAPFWGRADQTGLRCRGRWGGHRRQ